MSDRYCPPRICWCGSCAWWVPAPEPDYSHLIATADRASAKQRKSWETREDTTWIDAL